MYIYIICDGDVTYVKIIQALLQKNVFTNKTIFFKKRIVVKTTRRSDFKNKKDHNISATVRRVVIGK